MKLGHVDLAEEAYRQAIQIIELSDKLASLWMSWVWKYIVYHADSLKFNTSISQHTHTNLKCYFVWKRKQNFLT